MVEGHDQVDQSGDEFQKYILLFHASYFSIHRQPEMPPDAPGGALLPKNAPRCAWGSLAPSRVTQWAPQPKGPQWHPKTLHMNPRTGRTPHKNPDSRDSRSTAPLTLCLVMQAWLGLDTHSQNHGFIFIITTQPTNLRQNSESPLVAMFAPNCGRRNICIYSDQKYTYRSIQCPCWPKLAEVCAPMNRYRKSLRHYGKQPVGSH